MREVMRHPSVESCDLCDIDGVVVEQSKIHLKHSWSSSPGPIMPYRWGCTALALCVYGI